MKKYRYSKISLTFVILPGIIISVVAFLLYCKVMSCFVDQQDSKLIVKLITVEIAVPVALVCFAVSCRKNRFVELKELSVYFNSFPDIGRCNDFNVKYNDIDRIKVGYLPIIGVNSVIVLDKNGNSFKITRSFCKRNDLFHNLIRKIKQYNPDVFIDPKFEQDVMEKIRNEE